MKDTNYTIISFASVGDNFIELFIKKHSDFKFINALKDIDKLVLTNKEKIENEFGNVCQNCKYESFLDKNQIARFNDIINIDSLINKYVTENDKIVIIHSYAYVFYEEIIMKLAEKVVSQNKECVNVFTIPFGFTGKTEIFEKYKSEFLEKFSQNYYFKCNDLLGRLSPNLSLNETYDIIYAILFFIAFNLESDLTVDDIINKFLNYK